MRKQTLEEAVKDFIKNIKHPYKQVGNLLIIDNGLDGMSAAYFSIGQDFLNPADKGFSYDYFAISGDDMLEYSLGDFIYDYDFDDNATEKDFFSKYNQEEKDFFIAEYNRISKNAKHHDYYDADDNTWKDYN